MPKPRIRLQSGSPTSRKPPRRRLVRRPRPSRRTSLSPLTLDLGEDRGITATATGAASDFAVRVVALDIFIGGVVVAGIDTGGSVVIVISSTSTGTASASTSAGTTSTTGVVSSATSD